MIYGNKNGLDLSNTEKAFSANSKVAANPSPIVRLHYFTFWDKREKNAWICLHVCKPITVIITIIINVTIFNK